MMHSGLDLTRRSAQLVAALIIVAALAFLASRALGSGLGLYGAPTRGEAGSVAVTVPAAITTFIPSIAEDILTRGFLLRTVPIRLGLIGYTVASALLYAANHIWRFDWGISEQVRLFCLGLAYVAAAWRWRTLWAAVALHWGWNLSNMLVGRFMPIERLQVDGARLLSGAVHLAILAVVLLVPLAATRNQADDASRRLG